MRLAVISDIHANLGALDAVLADIGRCGADAVVNLGDILSGPLDPVGTAERLLALDLPTIRGNHERQLLACEKRPGGESDQWAYETLAAHPIWPRVRAWFESLPGLWAYTPEVFLCHGRPDTDLEYLLETLSPQGAAAATVEAIETRVQKIGYGLILCGHSHMPRTALTRDGRLVANPGSVGLQAFEDDHGYPHVIETGSPHARYLIAERKAGRWVLEHRLVAYDWESAARLARKNGREDWAIALETGRAQG